MLALLEMNCKQAILKFNEAQAEVTKREEMFQQHLAFKNRYDYTVSYLEEKSRKIQEDYKKIIQNMQEELAKSNDLFQLRTDFEQLFVKFVIN